MDASRAEAVQNFCTITGANEEQARFFLDSSNYEVDRAIEAFFDSGGGADAAPANANIDVESDDGQEEVSASAVPAAQASGVRAGQGAWPGVSGSSGGAKTGRPGAGGSRSKGRASGGIATLSDLNNRGSESGDESDDEGPQEYYAGGEKSGMMVQDPTKPSRSNVDDIFDRARNLGAREGTPADLHPEEQGGGRQAFRGTGHILSGEPRAPETRAPEAEAPPAPVMHTITFWRNGFTVDDGPLRRLDDPANRPFLQSIEKGECPRELEPPTRSTPVHVNLVRQDQEWKPPPEPKYRAFSGTGRTLSSSTGATSSSPSPSAATGAPPLSGTTPAGPERGLVVDESKPFTTIQLRLHDGTRMVARFNHHHTVGDIRRFIDSALPGGSPPNYLLMTAFPSKPLADNNATVANAGLINAVVIQKA